MTASAELLSSEYRRLNSQYVERFGYLALLVYAFFWLAQYDVSQTAESLVLLLFIVALVQRQPGLKAEPLLYLIYVWVFYQFLFIPLVVHEFPETMSSQVGWARHYAKLGLVIVVAWWLGGSVRNIVFMLALIASGFLLGVTFQEGGVLDSIEQLKRFERIGLGYINWEHVSVYAALVLIILITLRQRIVSMFGKYRWIGWGMVVGGALYCGLIVVLIQTRATWLGLIVALVVGSSVWMFTRYGHKRLEANAVVAGGLRLSRSSRNYLGIVIAVAIVVIAIFSSGLHKLIGTRLSHESDVVSALVQGKTDEFHYTSIGIRIAIWKQGLEWFAERPVFGWGPKTRNILIENSELPELLIKEAKIRHFHNQPIELAVAYGLVGLVVFGLAFYFVIRAAYRAWRDGRMPQDLMIFGVAFLSFWIVVNMFESYFNYSTGAYINALIGGAFFTFRFTEPKAV